ncbi:MAG TPA: T9SS type A sorting domain-containing protein [Bacteroidales bacterium]|nr:T9SS type A sorting domain-containing protein [Bacteroidales bacterium]
MKTLICILTIMFLLVRPEFSYSQAGNLDSSFGDGGKVISEIGTKDDYAFYSAIAADGSIISCGFYMQNNMADGFLIKYSANGIIDSTFGNNGIVKCNYFTEANNIAVLAFQTNGKIVAAGKISSDIMILRYEANGTPDSSFGNNGLVRTHIMTDQNATGLEILPGGKILISAAIYNGTNQDFGIIRYNTDGTFDTSFGNNGTVVSDLTNTWELNSSMKLQADGKIVMAGRVYSAAYDQSKCIIARYEADGALDISFGNNGKVITDVGPASYGVFNNLAIQADGKIIAVGYTIEDTGGGLYDNKNLTVRYNANGAPDSSFGTNGIVLTEVAGGGDIAWSVAIQADGKILVGGYTSHGFPSWESYFSLIRYDINGVLDPDLFMAGMVLTYFSDNETNAAYDIKIQSDGKILLTGMTAQDSTDAKNVALARFINDPDYSIQDHIENAPVSVFPIPSGGLFTICNNMPGRTNYDLKIYNVLGEQIYHSKINTTSTIIDLRCKPKGIYLINADLGDQSTTKKIIIE